MRRIILVLSFLALTGCDVASNADAARLPPANAPASADSAVGGTALDGAAVDPRRTIVIVGTSLTAGYGVGADAAYPAVLQHMIDSAGLPFHVVNAGISGETSAGGLRRIDWSLQQPTDVLLLELGANDALRGLDVGSLRINLDSILSRARELHPDIAIVLLGMEAPPNLGEDYTRRFRDVYRDLARRHGAVLVPFLLEGVAGDPGLNISDGIHPNAAGQRILARTVWEALEPVLRESAAAGRVQQ